MLQCSCQQATVGWQRYCIQDADRYTYKFAFINTSERKMIVEQRNNVGSAHTTPSWRDKPTAVSCERTTTYYRWYGGRNSDYHINGRCYGRHFNTLSGELLLFGNVPYVSKAKGIPVKYVTFLRSTAVAAVQTSCTNKEKRKAEWNLLSVFSLIGL